LRGSLARSSLPSLSSRAEEALQHLASHLARDAAKQPTVGARTSISAAPAWLGQLSASTISPKKREG
jgi:hypothetical protein